METVGGRCSIIASRTGDCEQMTTLWAFQRLVLCAMVRSENLPDIRELAKVSTLLKF